MHRPVPALALLAACSVYDLAEVPVDGGTPVQRAEVLAELEAFDQWTGGGRVSLRRIRFGDLRYDDVGGRYSRVSKGIKLDEDLDHGLVRVALRHELCHALGHQENLVEHGAALFDDEVDALVRYRERTGLSLHGSGRLLDGEVFARLCDRGPYTALALADGCEPERTTRLMSFMVREVWAGDAELLLVPMASDPPITWQGVLDEPLLDLVVTPTIDPAVVELWLQWEEVGLTEQVSLYTGQAARGQLPLEPVESIVPPLPELLQPVISQADEPWAVAKVAMHLGYLGDPSPRWMVHDHTAWSQSDACVSAEGSTLFITDGRPWAAWVGGDKVSWRPLD